MHSLTNISRSSIGATAYLSFGAIILGYSLWNRPLARCAASQAAPFALSVPVVGLVLAAVLLGECLVPTQWLGGAVVMAGPLLNAFGGRLAAWQAMA